MIRKKKFSIKKRAKSFEYAGKGILIFFRNEHNAWIHLFVLLLVCIVGVYFSITKTEWIAIITISAIVLMAEAFNTAIEYLANYVEPKHQPLIGKVKDVSAGAVLIVAIAAVTIGCIIFTPYLISLFL